jgi:hypothetical protein
LKDDDDDDDDDDMKHEYAQSMRTVDNYLILFLSVPYRTRPFISATFDFGFDFRQYFGDQKKFPDIRIWEILMYHRTEFLDSALTGDNITYSKPRFHKSA